MTCKIFNWEMTGPSVTKFSVEKQSSCVYQRSDTKVMTGLVQYVLFIVIVQSCSFVKHVCGNVNIYSAVLCLTLTVLESVELEFLS